MSRTSPEPAGGSPIRVVPRLRDIAPFVVIGLLCVTAGGLVAAVTAAAPAEKTTWAAAYLVLVAGLAQAGLGLGQAMFAPRTSRRLTVAQVAGWNAANAAVLVGTLASLRSLVYLGGVLLLTTLISLARGVRARVGRSGDRVRHWWLYGYRLLVLVLLVSVPAGLVLATTGR